MIMKGGGIRLKKRLIKILNVLIENGFNYTLELYNFDELDSLAFEICEGKINILFYWKDNSIELFEYEDLSKEFVILIIELLEKEI